MAVAAGASQIGSANIISLIWIVTVFVVIVPGNRRQGWRQFQNVVETSLGSIIGDGSDVQQI